MGGQDLASLNQCHMYLRVVYLSDICNAARMAVDLHGQGIASAQPIISAQEWKNQ